MMAGWSSDQTEFKFHRVGPQTLHWGFGRTTAHKVVKVQTSYDFKLCAATRFGATAPTK